METTRSFSSSTLGSIFASATFFSLSCSSGGFAAAILLGEDSEGAVEALSD
jgi:hypothetical protein